MTQKHKRKLLCFSLGISGILALALSGERQSPSLYQDSSSFMVHGWQMGAYLTPRVREMHSSAPENSQDEAIRRVAKRFQVRLWRHLGTTPSLTTIEYALKQRRALLQSGVSLHFETEREDIPDVFLGLQARPLWIGLDVGYDRLSYSLDKKRIQSDVTKYGLPGVSLPQDVLLSSIQDEESSSAGDERFARAGYVFDVEEVTTDLVHAFKSQSTQALIIPLTYRNGTVILEDAMGDATELTLLASGRSNFRGSPYGRKKNIHKAVEEHLNHRIIHPGEEFSFNATLGGPVTLDYGWYESLGIFNSGDELRPTPGGGICQVSTTLYRAVLLSGLPVLERRSHSLYVGYYRKYGVGLDATIFPGTQDLVFMNNTPGDLVIEAVVENDEDVIVNIYGISDGRTIALEGPFVTENAPDDFRVKGRRLGYKEIAWKQFVHYPDGRTEENVILSYYKEEFSHYQVLANAKIEEIRL